MAAHGPHSTRRPARIVQTADPNGAVALGPLSVANGVVYANSRAGDPDAPTMLALNAATGGVSASFASGASVNAGATIVDETVFWGSGYTHLGIPGYTGSNKFYAFKRIGKVVNDTITAVAIEAPTVITRPRPRLLRRP